MNHRDEYISLINKMDFDSLKKMRKAVTEMIMSDKDCKIGREGLDIYPNSGLQLLPMWRAARSIKYHLENPDYLYPDIHQERSSVYRLTDNYVWYFKRRWQKQAIPRRIRLIEMAKEILGTQKEH